MGPDERNADFARLDERTKNLVSAAERWEKIVDKLPCVNHATRLTRLETRISLIVGVASLIGGALVSVLTRAMGG